MTWTIWTIKNRWLRAAVAWPTAAAAVIGLAALVAVLTVVAAITGAFRNVVDTYKGLADGEWSSLAADAWAAMTGKEPAGS